MFVLQKFIGKIPFSRTTAKTNKHMNIKTRNKSVISSDTGSFDGQELNTTSYDTEIRNTQKQGEMGLTK